MRSRVAEVHVRRSSEMSRGAVARHKVEQEPQPVFQDIRQFLTRAYEVRVEAGRAVYFQRGSFIKVQDNL
jgi:hypothetical protein